jgi:hypothetical protein
MMFDDFPNLKMVILQFATLSNQRVYVNNTAKITSFSSTQPKPGARGLVASGLVR